LFTGEEAWGKFLDLTESHERYLNLPSIKRLTYLQYLDNFFVFTAPQCPIKKDKKLTDNYFTYIGELASYLEGFMRRTQPLEDVDKQFAAFDRDFERLWESNEMPGWGLETVAGPSDPNTQGAVWCADCAKEFKNENVYNAHLTGKKHIKAVEARKANSNGSMSTAPLTSAQRLKERAIAEREHRITSLADALSSIRTATRVNVERRQGMTERERQQELEALFAESNDNPAAGEESEQESDSEEKIYNPLKLPLAWDGKPIPYWLYKLHGLGVEFPCEICGNFVYMGRRAFDKHFTEARHIYGLKCLGITNTTLFREITGIQDALKLWEKLQKDKKAESLRSDVVQMEDAEGNVMPEKVYLE
jgi:splicing factor 3A subunit 3